MSIHDFKLWFFEFNQFSGLAGILYFLFFVRKWKSNVGIIFYILFASLFADVVVYFFIRFIYPNSYVISNIWYLINYLLMMWLFYRLLKKKRSIIIGLLVVFILGSILSFYLFFSFYEPNTFIRFFTSVSFIVLPLVTFFEILKIPDGKLSESPIFWLATSFFIYSSLTLLKNLFQQYMVFDLHISAETSSIVALINLSANIFKNFVLFYVIVLIDKGFPDNIPKPIKP